MSKKNIWILSFALMVITQSDAGLASINDQASVAYLRKDCSSMNDCFTSMGTLLPWIWGTRIPTQDAPLLVDIGPGTFEIRGATSTQQIFCENGGYVTFRGAGRGTTVLKGPGANAPTPLFGAQKAAVAINDCTNLSFQDMTIRANLTGNGASTNGVAWVGGGLSNWNNVSIEAPYYAWFDVCSESGTKGTHVWTASHLESNGAGVLNVAYRSDCGSSEIHGSSLLATKIVTNGPNWSLIGAIAGANGKIAIYGSSVRSVVPSDAAGITYSTNYNPAIEMYGQGGLLAVDGGMIHMHGGIVSVRYEPVGPNSSVFGAQARGLGSMIHTPDTAYGLRVGGTGTTERIILEGSSMVDAPYQWPAGDEPPKMTSISGSDYFVETDCDSTGNCANAGNQSHPMIYSSAECGAVDPWLDTRVNQCRALNQPPAP